MLAESQHAFRPAVPLRNRPGILGLFLLLASFLLLYFLVPTSESGDTLRYAADIVHHSHGDAAQFWEFGHLLWRPWGYLGLRSFGQGFESYFGDTEAQAATRFLVCTNFICCLLTLLLIWDLARRLVSATLATFVSVAFCGANCFLDYASLGSAYLPALLFECLALWLLAQAAERSSRMIFWATLAGISYAVSIALWFPYIFAGLGLVLFLLLWPLTGRETFSISDRLPQTAAFLLTLAIAAVVLFSAGAAAKGIHSGADFKQWIVESDSGWSQRLNLVRAATGIPRALFELAGDTILLKRWFFHDPYNPVHLGQLAGVLFLKLVLFYLGVAALLWILLREPVARRTLVVLLGAAVPLLFFAVYVFEPSSTSRYLPILPFIYLAAAIALAYGSKRRFAFAAVAVLLVSAVILNAFTLAHEASGSISRVREQRAALDNQIAKEAIVFIPTLHDEFYQVPLTRPLDHTLISRKYRVLDIVEIASLRVLHWRAEFADHVQAARHQGQEIWLSQRVYAPHPNAAGPWIEGDDPRIHWAELPQFFRQFQSDKSVDQSGDGFVRLSDNAQNSAALQQVLTADPNYVPQALLPSIQSH